MTSNPAEDCLFFFLNGKRGYACKLIPKSVFFKEKKNPTSFRTYAAFPWEPYWVLSSELVESEGKAMPASKDRETCPARLFFCFRCEFHGTHGVHRTWVCLLDTFPGRKAAGAPHSISSVHCSPQLFLREKKLVGKYIRVTQAVWGSPFNLLSPARKTSGILPCFLRPRWHAKCRWMFFREMNVKSVLSRDLRK